MKLVLLPGMDGTGELFEPFAQALPSNISPFIISYPANEALGYDELFDFVRARLPTQENFVLLGESFSGPIALKIAAQSQERLKALILTCTFASHPRPALASLSALASLAFSLRPPKRLIQAILTNGAQDLEMAQKVQTAIGQVSRIALNARIKAINELPLSTNFAAVKLPSLYLQASKDRVVPDSCYLSLKRCISSLQLQRLSGPHCLLQVKPVESAKVVEQFLNSVT